MGELEKLPNIGKELERQLNEAGIFTREDLDRYGSRNAWLKIQENDSSACIHRLLAMEGALQGVKKTLLPPEIKADLKEFYTQNKIKHTP